MYIYLTSNFLDSQVSPSTHTLFEHTNTHQRIRRFHSRDEWTYINHILKERKCCSKYTNRVAL